MALRAASVFRFSKPDVRGLIPKSAPLSNCLTSKSARQLVPRRGYSGVLALQGSTISHPPASLSKPFSRFCTAGALPGHCEVFPIQRRCLTMATIKLSPSLTATDPSKQRVFIIGNSKNLHKAGYEQLKCKLQPAVSESTFQTALQLLAAKGCDSVPLFLNSATISQLPSKCSRHNTPTQAHAISKLVLKHSSGRDESVVIVCEKNDAFASVCAVARSYPLYSRKTGDSAENERTIDLEVLLVDGATLSDDDMVAMNAAIEGVRLAARITDTPCMELNVCKFLEEVQAVGKSLNITPTIIRGEELRDKGLGGIWNVGKAASSLPALAVLSHTPAGATETIAWVGKGIVYDTGGLSLKTRLSMLGMKKDCGGAAGILGAFSAIVKSGFQQNLHAVFCLAENAIGPLATRVDDVFAMYSGKTVEINNTDAEGRLVLGDGVAYAKKDLGAKIILDMATLTGAQGVATGKYHAAVVTNSGDWEQAATFAGRRSGDLTFPLPYSPELHFKEYNSTVADMRNSVADRANAQVSCAGLFIQSHLGSDFDGDWIHVDMASPVEVGDRATGYGVALLSSLFGNYTSNPLLKNIAPNLPKKKN